MGLTPEEIAEKFIAEGYGMHASLVKLIREHGEQLLKSEQERLENMVTSLNSILDCSDLPYEEIAFSKGEIQGVELAIENIRQTLKS